MQISPNAVDTVTPIAFIEHSNSFNNFVGGFVVTVPTGAGFTLAVSQTPTPSVKELMIAIDSGFFPGNIVLRKYFAAGQEFVDEVIPLTAAGNTAYKSITLLETCEVYLTNLAAVPLPAKVTIIGRS